MASANWTTILKYNPIEPLLGANDECITFFAKKDLQGKSGQNANALWELPEAKRLASKQQPNGSWSYPGGNHKLRSIENYDQLETYRNLGYLVEMFGFNKTSPVIQKAADFLFKFQTPEGDIRGILGNQYTPYYTAAMAELFIKAGYQDDVHITKIFAWLASVRQNDGGWALPLRTLDRTLDVISMEAETLQGDVSRPYSHLITGVVLRAYAAHPTYCHSTEAKQAGRLLQNSLFKKDSYPDRGSEDYWLRFSFPFWFTDLISATDTLSRLGFSKDEPQIQRAINWFIDNQNKDGLWHLKALKNLKYHNELWFSLSICRILKRFYS